MKDLIILSRFNEDNSIHIIIYKYLLFISSIYLQNFKNHG